ncbi:hypothetical protein ABT282_07140 [Streptomyces sp. NPDC000927]|uniref:hypothetical protein n=1 Tax=Streptomyces sp. NPDC000927 TaxID=3154371 RepID=UPI0033330104
MSPDAAWEMVAQAFHEKAEELRGRFPEGPAVRAGDPWVDGWLTAADYVDLKNPELYTPDGIPR